jgi:hypothetical protein
VCGIQVVWARVRGSGLKCVWVVFDCVHTFLWLMLARSQMCLWHTSGVGSGERQWVETRLGCVRLCAYVFVVDVGTLADLL